MATFIVLVSFSAMVSSSQTLACLACDGGVVDKAPYEAFTVKITFKNTGKAKGTWFRNFSIWDDVIDSSDFSVRCYECYSSDLKLGVGYHKLGYVYDRVPPPFP